MVNGGSIAARALFYMSSHVAERADQATYTTNTVSAINTLQTWYNEVDGLWDTTGWWNSANCFTTLADFAALDPSDANKLNLGSIFANTYTNAQKITQVASKSIGDSGMVVSAYARLAVRDDTTTEGAPGFINDYYDDEGWWALALVRAYDVTGDQTYLTMAESIFEDMKNGTDGTCGGGIWWSKDHTYKNAIANELFLAVGASLANRVADNKAYYLGIANQQWAWFKGSGMINAQNTINDGLTINSDGSCTNNGQNVWSYNQGVILGGLVELSKANGDTSLITEATTIATAAISALSVNGILTEVCDAAGSCGGDGASFKGIFMRNLHYLYKAGPDAASAQAFQAYILQNADSIWAHDRFTSNTTFGLPYAGPPTTGGPPTAATHSSAMDALVAAMGVA